MVVVIILGVVIWLVMAWFKRRVAANTDEDDVTGKLPKDFLDKPEVKKEVKMGAYAEARKKYMAEKKKHVRKDLLDEALINYNVRKEKGFVETNCNEGAFGIAERRKMKAEAMREMQKELDAQMEKEDEGQNKKRPQK